LICSITFVALDAFLLKKIPKWNSEDVAFKNNRRAFINEHKIVGADRLHCSGVIHVFNGKKSPAPSAFSSEPFLIIRRKQHIRNPLTEN
jgi:hypothetical protein